MKCGECAAALYQSTSSTDHPYTRVATLVSLKSHGGLLLPPDSLLQVVRATDKKAREACLRWSGITVQTRKRIAMEVLRDTRSNIFTSLARHAMECHAIDSIMERDHVASVIDEASHLFMKIFFHQFATIHTHRIVKSGKPSTRQKLTKAVLFYHD